MGILLVLSGLFFLSCGDDESDVDSEAEAGVAGEIVAPGEDPQPGGEVVGGEGEKKAGEAEVANFAASFDGVDFESYISAKNHDVFNKALEDTYTIECWYKPAKSDGELMVLNKEDEWEFANKGGIFQSAVAADGNPWAWLDSEIKNHINKWNHAAIVWDGKELHHFINGKKGKSHALPGKSVKPTKSTFKIGRRERGGATHSIFDGLIDEVRISNNVRYDADYEVPKVAFVPDDNTMYLLHLDEDDIDGDSIKNFGKMGPDATLEGAVELVEAELPNTERRALAVEPASKLGTVWGRLKRNRF
jgi:hypothetical protein|tara:strand:+ start:1341 stop:2252 length:912 start_codon:yes stop_codon:yes gene_type:complete